MKLRVLTRGGLLMFALAFVVAGLAFPLAASAVTEPAVWKSGGIDYAKGTIALGARFETPTAEVQLWSGTTLLSTAVAVSPNTTVRLAPYRLKSKVTLKVRALKQDRTVLWERLVTLDPASYKPHKPKLTNTVFSMVVPTSTWTYRGTAGHPVTKIKAYNRQAEKTTYYPQTLEATGKFHFTVKLSYLGVTGLGRSRRTTGSASPRSRSDASSTWGPVTRTRPATSTSARRHCGCITSTRRA